VLGIVAIVVGLAYSGYVSYRVNALNRTDPRELLVSTQTSEEVPRIAERVVARSERQPTSITVDASEGATFPWAWYFRHLPVNYLELGAGSTAELPDSDVLILTPGANDRLAPQLGGYEGRELPFRVWWLRDYDAMSAGAWRRWFTDLETWNPTGGMSEWFYERPSR
jgi:hypothetical protein